MAKKKTKATDITLEKAVPAFLEHLEKLGKNKNTVTVYGRCLDNVITFFKPEKQLSKITPALSGQFLKCDALLKKPNGKLKSEITVKQNVRVYRMMLTWAVEKKYISDVPLPKAELKGDKKKNGNGNKPDDAE